MRLLLSPAGFLTVLASASMAQEAPTANVPVGGGEAVGDEIEDGPAPFVLPLGQESVAGTGSVTTQLGFYRHDDGPVTDGHPFIDEDLFVLEPIVVWDYNVSDTWGYSFELAYDRVSSASIERLSNFPGQSGASGDNYVGARFDSRHRISNEDVLSWHLGYSTEYDYNSIALGGGWKTTAEDESSSDSLNIDAFFDTLDLIRWDGAEEGTDDRLSVAGSWTHYQIFSPRWNGEVSATLSYQSGFLATPYNPVAIEDGSNPGFNLLDVPFDGQAVSEALPDTRVRGSLSAVARRWLGKGRALELGGRLYADDWGIVSATLEPRYLFPLGETLDLALGYRYYSQGAADDYSERFTELSEFRTQDPDLGDFDAHTLTTEFRWQASPRRRWTYGLNYTLRSDGLDYIWAFLSWSWSF